MAIPDRQTQTHEADDSSIDAYDFELPAELIARTPASCRDESRLLVVPRDAGSPTHHSFRDLPTFLRAGDRLVLNQTRVLPARLEGTRSLTGGKWSGLFIAASDDGSCRVLAKTKGTPRPGEFIDLRRGSVTRVIRLLERGQGGEWIAEPCDTTALEILHAVGRPPLPPYILKARRDAGEKVDRDDDPIRYQTVFAGTDRDSAASIAAPTAGLHFTPELLQTLRDRGIGITSVTLHVGEGTFRPVTATNLDDHAMHAEIAAVSETAASEINATRMAGGRIVAVGTTSARTIETAARGGRVAAWEGETDLFIRPGFEFRALDGLITNFHLPKSTLMVLVSALAGRRRILSAYEDAIAKRYRFYSFGDAMLIL